MKKLIGIQKIDCPVEDCKFSSICSYGQSHGSRSPLIEFNVSKVGMTKDLLYLICQSYEQKRKPGRPKTKHKEKVGWLKTLKEKI